LCRYSQDEVVAWALHCLGDMVGAAPEEWLEKKGEEVVVEEEEEEGVLDGKVVPSCDGEGRQSRRTPPPPPPSTSASVVVLQKRSVVAVATRPPPALCHPAAGLYTLHAVGPIS
jgi:hypothetical protein